MNTIKNKTAHNNFFIAKLLIKSKITAYYSMLDFKGKKPFAIN